MLLRRYGVLLALFLLTFGMLVYGIAADSKRAALFINGVTANLFDPFVWLIALPFVRIRRPFVLLASLFTVSSLVCIFKVYMLRQTGAHWITGSIAGNIIGLLTVGYIINAFVVFRRARATSTVGPDNA